MYGMIDERYCRGTTIIRPKGVEMDLLDISEQRQMSREDAAHFLHELADSLASHNSMDLLRNGVKLNIKVPDKVTVELEVEIESDESSIEIEISW